MIRALFTLAIASLLLVPASAGAWEALTSCGGGNYTAWPGGQVEWRYATNYPSGDFSETEAIQIIADSFEEWGEPGCSGLTPSRASDTSGDPMYGNSNLTVGFYQNNWPYSLGSGVLAVTYPSWNGSCDLTSATITMNEQHHNWSSNGSANDAQSVMTHEVGHYVGLDHNASTSSSIYWSYSGGTTERTLYCDDTAAMCTLYPSSGTACGPPANSDYCPCGQTCQDGWCNGVESGAPWGEGDDDDSVPPSDDDDSWGDDDDFGDDDDDDDSWEPPNGGCTGPPESFSESEPNNWDGSNDYNNFIGNGGDVTISAETWCFNNGNEWLGDVDWFVIDVPCGDQARVTVDWSGGSSDLDFWVYDENTDLSVNNMDEDYNGPVMEQTVFSNRAYIAVACWTGPPLSYTVEVDFEPWGWDPSQEGDDDDDDDDDGPGPGDDDDTSSQSDDDDATPGGDDDDDDGGELENDGDDDDGGDPDVTAASPGVGPENLLNAGCGCGVADRPAASPAWALLLGVLPWVRRRRG
ncbi:MAG: matrixin family metalloprotease [Proteobacteria bacterium]|nr:matrixin family metalloprotease [Pseudomonadota bacterium]